MNNAYVLSALKIFTQDYMLSIAQTSQSRAALRKAAGEELVGWHEDRPYSPKRGVESEARILEFPRASVGAKGEESDSNLLFFWQRSHRPDNLKEEFIEGYRKATEIYMVKTKDQEGKQKIRFASTHGVLVNKKQA